jgi:hypothetical protein
MLVGAALTMLATGCAPPVPQPVDGRAQGPRVGWVIMTGDAENPDRDFVCQSNPPSECVVPVDRPDERAVAHVHLYYHAAPTETKYTGSVRVDFFDEPQEFRPDITVKPGERPGNQSVWNFVTGTPGSYTMSIAVVATPTQGGEDQNIRDQVSVSVK